ASRGRRVVDRDRLLVAASRGVVRGVSHDDRSREADRSDLEEGARPGRRGVGWMAEGEAIPAASAIVLRDSPLEVLMMRRNETASFVPNMWVFPGGAVEQLDGEIDGTLLGRMRVAAARELFEETGVWLGAPLENADSKRRRLLAGILSFRQIL